MSLPLKGGYVQLSGCSVQRVPLDGKEEEVIVNAHRLCRIIDCGSCNNHDRCRACAPLSRRSNIPAIRM